MMWNTGEKLSKLKDKIWLHPQILRARWTARKIDKQLSPRTNRILQALLLLFVIFLITYKTLWTAPKDFPDQALVTVERGKSLSEIASSFEKQRAIKSAFWLKVFMKITGGETKIIAGDYYFPNKVNIFTIVNALHKGQFGLIPIRVTIFEGTNSYEIADLLEKNLPAFNKKDFIQEVKDTKSEGYLFPDTYFFMPNTKAKDAILIMKESFARQIKPYMEDIVKSKRSIEDIVIMASIIEEEAKGIESKRIVSGILWKRLSKDMLLQVDAPFKYYNGKNSYTLTKDDLKEDHEYNTYTRKGLPPTSIASPGIDSIKAAIAPTNTEYLYFLSDRSGNTYYAKDFDGHQSNRELYLR